MMKNNRILIKWKNILILGMVILLLIPLALKARDIFWYHEYTYFVGGFYEDTSSSEFLKEGAVCDGTYTPSELKGVSVQSGHYVLVKPESGLQSSMANLRIRLKRRMRNGQLVNIGVMYHSEYSTIYKNQIKKYLSLVCGIPDVEEDVFYIANYSADVMTFDSVVIREE